MMSLGNGAGGSGGGGNRSNRPLRPLPVVGKRGERFEHPDVVSVPSVEVELWCGPARVKDSGWRSRRKRPKLQRSMSLILPNCQGIFNNSGRPVS